MKCEGCGSGVENDWRFCPRCGSGRRRGMFNFSSLFNRMFKEMDEMGKETDDLFERDIEAVDLSPFRKLPRTRNSGYTIRITSGAGMEPRVEVRTFGNVDQERINRQLRQMGYGPGKAAPAAEAARKKLPTPATTEEPKTEVKSLGNRVVVDMELPGVSSENDIDVAELESSVEVKALAGDKAYFKILTLPEEFRLAAKKFEKGRLHLEFA